MADDPTLERLRPTGGIHALITRPATTIDRSANEDFELLPSPNDGYQPHSVASARTLMSLHLFFPDHAVENYQYSELSSRSRFVPSDPAGGGNLIHLRFSGPGLPEVLISGRNLRPLFDLITQHRCGWVRVLPEGRDFQDAATPVITRIVSRLVEGEDCGNGNADPRA